ncbi:hypothetical protein C8R48DRAFT_781084 [Suillus tomentosus]|nr:hypothetical protein C8R48DRAFT_781084 [Suillus tomentosus]
MFIPFQSPASTPLLFSSTFHVLGSSHWHHSLVRNPIRSLARATPSRPLHPRALYTLFSLSSEFWDVRSSRKGASYLLNNSQHSRLALTAHFHESLSW